MPHSRKRHIYDRFEKLCRFSPLVGLFGHRQVGKTTFVEMTAKKYITFDQEKSLNSANLDAESFLKENHSQRTVIDECQLSPKIFPALKDWVRKNKKPGQFILTGSVRFTSRKAIRESLTGRIVSSELLPLTVSELLENELPVQLIKILEAESFNHLDLLKMDPKFFKNEYKALDLYLTHGGLPGICFVRDSKIRKDYLDTLLSQILDEDLRQVIETKLSLSTLKRYLQFLAKNTLKPYSYAEVKRSLGLAELTQKKLLFAFESIYLIRKISVTGMKGEVVFLEDQLEEFDLSGNSLSTLNQKITAFYRNIRAQFIYRSGMQVEFFQYRTRGGAYVPLALQSDLGTIGFIFIDHEKPELSEKRSAESFLRKFPRSKILYISTSQAKPMVIEADILMIPISSLF